MLQRAQAKQGSGQAAAVQPAELQRSPQEGALQQQRGTVPRHASQSDPSGGSGGGMLPCQATAGDCRPHARLRCASQAQMATQACRERLAWGVLRVLCRRVPLAAAAVTTAGEPNARESMGTR